MCSSKSFIVSDLTFRSLIHFEFIFVCGVRKWSFHSFTSGWPVFPAPLVKEIVFSPLYILASFVEDKVSIGAWIYLWAFHFVPWIYISVFVPIPYCLDDCGFVVEPVNGADEWIRKLWYIYTMEYYSAIKKNTFQSVLMRWMKLEPIIQSEVSQKEKHQYSILTHIYGI